MSWLENHRQGGILHLFIDTMRRDTATLTELVSLIYRIGWYVDPRSSDSVLTLASKLKLCEVYSNTLVFTRCGMQLVGNQLRLKLHRELGKLCARSSKPLWHQCGGLSLVPLTPEDMADIELARCCHCRLAGAQDFALAPPARIREIIFRKR